MPVNVTHLINPVEMTTDTAQADFINGGTALDHIRAVTGDVSPDEIVLACDRVIVEPDFIIPDGSEIIFFVIISGGGDAQSKGILRTVAMIALTVALTVINPPAGATFGAKVAFYGVMAVGAATASLVINSVLADPKLGTDSLAEESMERSQNYGFTAAKNASDEGAVIPSIIGSRVVSPPIGGAYRYTSNSTQIQRLRLLCILSDDLIEDILPEHIFINGHTIDEYPEANYEYTIGDDTQVDPINWFENSLSEIQHTINISDQSIVSDVNISFTGFINGTYQPVTPYALALNHEVLNVTLNFPNGLWYRYLKRANKISKSDRNVDRWVNAPIKTFEFLIRYRPITGGAWVEKRIPIMPPKAFRKRFTAIATIDHVVGEYEYQFSTFDLKSQSSLEVTNIKARSSLGGVTYVTTNGLNVEMIGVGLLLPNGIYYINDNGGFSNHSVEVVIEYRVTGTTEWTTGTSITITDNTSSQLRRFIQFDYLTPAQYDVRAYVPVAMPTDTKYRHTVYLDYIQEGIDDAIVYRGLSVLALDIPATEDLHGQYPTVEVFLQCSDYDTGQSSSNPAWAAYFRLVSNGIPETMINLSEFTEWATFCDTENLTTALYLDVQLELQAILNQISIAGRATVVQRSGRWGVIIDRADDPVQLFSHDNIILDSFTESFLPFTDRANCIQVWFFDEDHKYRKTGIEILDPEIPSASEIRKTEYTLYGVVNKEQARRHAVYLLNHTRMIDKTISFNAAIDAINCAVGDLILFQHNLPIWGFAPGRVVGATAANVTCDIPIDFSDPENATRNFRINIRHTSPRTGENVDFLETKNIENPYLLGTPNNETVTVFTLDLETWERIPEPGSIVSVGWVIGTESSTGDELLSTKQFRITKIERYDDKTFSINALAHYDDAYEDDFIVNLPPIASGLQPVSLPVAQSAWRVVGNVESNFVTLSWLGNAPRYYVYYQTADGAGWNDWIFHAEVPETFTQIDGLSADINYRFSVSSVNNPELGTLSTLSHTVEDHVSLIQPITTITTSLGGTTWNGRDLIIQWDEFPLFSLQSYRVEILSGPAGSVLRTDTVFINSYIYPYSSNVSDYGGPSYIVYVRVVVIDTTGNEAISYTQALTNNLPAAITNLLTTAGSASAFTGRDLDLVWDASTDEDFSVYEIVISDGTGTRRTEFIAQNHYLYSYSMNIEDGLENNIIVSIRAIDAFNQASGIVQQTFDNPAPATPTGLTASPWMSGVEFSWTLSTESDFNGYNYRTRVEAEAWSGWQNTFANSIQRFLSEAESAAYGGSATISIEIRSIDTFGTESATAALSQITDSLNIPPTSITNFSQISSAFPKIPVLIGDVWSDNTPSAGSVFWNEFSIWYNGVEHVIISGSTADQYIFWNNGALALSGSVDVPVLPDDSFIIATNINGVHDLAWNAIANQIIGSAYIKDAAINDLHVNDVSASKLTANSIMTPGVYIGGAQYGSSGGTPTIDSLQPAEGGATDGATWGGNLNSIPARFGESPSAAGLYVTSTHLGYYDGIEWDVFIQSNGNFHFGGDGTQYIDWDGTDLTISGTVNITSPSSGYENLTDRPIRPSDDYLVAHYSFDEISELTAYDVSRHLHHFTLTNAPPRDAGVSGRSLHIAAANQHGTGSIYPQIDNQSFTISVWLRRSAIGLEAIAFSKGHLSGTADTYFMFGFRATGTFFVGFNGDDLDSTNPFATDITNFHNYSCSYDQSTRLMRGYIDGVFINERIFNAQLSSTNSDEWEISGVYGGDTGWLNGYIDEWRIYHRVLTDSEIKYLYSHPSGRDPVSIDTQNVSGYDSALVANAQGFVFRESFNDPGNNFADRYHFFNGGSGWQIITSSESLTGGKFLRCGDGSGDDMTWFVFNRSIPYDPNRLYRMSVRVRAHAGTTGTCQFGVAGRFFDDSMYISRVGTNDYGNFSTVSGDTITLPANSAWQEYYGFFSGWAATGGLWSQDPANPTALHQNIKWIRPILLVMQVSQSGFVDFDEIAIEAIPKTEDSPWRHASDTTKIDGGDIYANSITLNTINGASGTLDIQAGGQISVTAGKIVVSTSDGLEVTGTGGMQVLDGGDIIMRSGAASASHLTFIDSQSANHSFDIQYTSGILIFEPIVGNYSSMRIGIANRLTSFQLDSGYLKLIGGASSILSYSMSPSGDKGLNFKTHKFDDLSGDFTSVSVSIDYSTSYRWFGPSDEGIAQNNLIDLGRDASAWKDIWYYVAHDKCLYLDDLDDLEILKQVKPSKELDEKSGLQKLDIASLPRWATNYYELKEQIMCDCECMMNDEDFDYFITDEEHLGYRLFRRPGHYLDLVAGAVKQLEKRIKLLEKDV